MKIEVVCGAFIGLQPDKNGVAMPEKVLVGVLHTWQGTHAVLRKKEAKPTYQYTPRGFSFPRKVASRGTERVLNIPITKLRLA